jgi:glycosyltransferase involved in cell wall biosynthesis
VISTALGAEGLGGQQGRHLLLAETAQELADATLAVIKDRALGARLAAEGRRLVEERYGWQAIGRRLSETLAAVE